MKVCSRYKLLVSVFLFVCATLAWYVSRLSFDVHNLGVTRTSAAVERERVDSRHKHFTIPQDVEVNEARTPPTYFQHTIWRNKLVSLHQDVRLVPSTPPKGFVLPDKDCVPLPRSPTAGVVICVYPTELDMYVSGALKNGVLWEEHLVLMMKRYLETDPDLILVDLGSNIGQYSLFAAAMGHRVLAVEMMPRNVQHLQTALQISGLGSKVTIVNNALYSDHRSLKVQFLEGNIGGTRVNDSHTSKIHLNQSSVQTICLDDLTPILAGSKAYVKMDIENTEHQALQCATIFFSEVDIQVIQMEWLDREMQASEQILDFMDAYGYIISKDPNLHEPVHKTSIPKDIFFIKKPPTF